MRKTLLLLALFAAAPADAKDMYQQFAVFGVGARPCSAYLDARAAGDGPMQAYHAWIAGYLSAFNLIVDSTYDIRGDRSYPELLGWLDERCRSTPDESFVNALANLTENLYPERRSFVKPPDAEWGR